MNAATITAMASGIVAVLGAAGALYATIRHASNPGAHAANKEGDQP